VIERVVDSLRPIPFRGKRRLLGALVPRTGERVAKVFGYDVKLDLAEHVQRDVYLGTFEPEDTRRVRRFLRPGMTVADVGAHVGYYTLLAASCVGAQGRVLSFEPNPRSSARLEATVRANGLTHVRTFRVALSSSEGSRELFSSGDPAASLNASLHGSPDRGGNENPAKESVPTRTLDACCAEVGVERIDLLKIDVEGHEPEAFRGAKTLIAAGKIDAVLCELNDYWLREAGSSARELHRWLVAAGFDDVDGEPAFAHGAVVNRFFRRRS
jgi:FkbM family methyltransferase